MSSVWQIDDPTLISFICLCSNLSLLLFQSQTVAINKELQDSGKELARKNDDLIQCEIQQCNVAAAIEKLTICLPVLQLYSKMCELMRNGR